MKYQYAAGSTGIDRLVQGNKVNIPVAEMCEEIYGYLATDQGDRVAIRLTNRLLTPWPVPRPGQAD